MYLLDTSMLSEVVKRHPNTGVMQRLHATAPPLYTAAICIMELRYGVLLRPDHEAFWQRIRRAILSKVQILEFGEPEALIAGEFLAHLRRAGRPIGLEDVLIGAIARRHGYTVVTRNLRHFHQLPHVNAENWFSV